MPRFAPILLAASIALAGCGTTGSADDAPATPTPVTGTEEGSVAAGEEQLEAVDEQLQALGRRKAAAKKAGNHGEAEQLEQAMRDIERAQEEAADAEFGTDDPYDKAVDTLPLGKPPLYVKQFMIDDSHELVVRIAPRRFFCDRTPEQRLTAVSEYYAQARRKMAAAGIDDFAMVVDGLRDSGVVRALARAQGDEVSLTARGRGTGPC